MSICMSDCVSGLKYLLLVPRTHNSVDHNNEKDNFVLIQLDSTDIVSFLLSDIIPLTRFQNIEHSVPIPPRVRYYTAFKVWSLYLRASGSKTLTSLISNLASFDMLSDLISIDTPDSSWSFSSMHPSLHISDSNASVRYLSYFACLLTVMLLSGLLVISHA